MQLSMYLTFFTDKIWVFGTKSDASVVFFPQQPALLGVANCMKTLDNPHEFTVHGVAFNGARRARGVQVDLLAIATLWNVECTYRKYFHSRMGRDATWIATLRSINAKGWQNVTPTTAISSKSYPFVCAHYYPPCQDSNKCPSMPPKIQNRVYFSLASLRVRTRSRPGRQGERRSRGVEADLRGERSKKLKKKIEILKCRDSDTKADRVKKIVADAWPRIGPTPLHVYFLCIISLGC